MTNDIQASSTMALDNDFDGLDLQARHDGRFQILSVRGEVDMASVPRLQAALEEAQRGGKTLVVDLTEVGFLDSAGLSTLLTVSKSAPHQLRVVAAGEIVRPIELTGLDKLLAVYDTLAAAVAAEDRSQQM